VGRTHCAIRQAGKWNDSPGVLSTSYSRTNNTNCSAPVVANRIILCFPDAGAGRDAVPVCSVDGATSIAPGNKHKRAHPRNAQPSSPRANVLVLCRELCTIIAWNLGIISCNL
jgi:hypothetical protein